MGSWYHRSSWSESRPDGHHVRKAATMPIVPVSPGWRRLLRLNVRGLLVLVLLVALGLGWTVRSARIQREAVTAIRIAGGRVTYDRGQKIGPSIPKQETRPPEWLLNAVGADYFYSVKKVWFFIPLTSSPSASETDEALAHVGRLTRLKYLIVVRPLSDAGLVHLKGLKSLTYLHLSGTQITDAGMVHLKELTNLSTVSLNETKVTDVGIRHLEGLTNLEDLYLRHTQVTDAGLVHLKGLTQLSSLDLAGTQVTDAGLVHLKGLTNLSVLDLDGTRVTEAGIEELNRALPSLKVDR
jgi:Leucine-rich repeat (LRR) protein